MGPVRWHVGSIDRTTPDDLLELAVDRGPVPWQVGVLLVLDRPIPLTDLRDALAQRIQAIPRLRRRLVRTPPLCGRPIWIDDPGFIVERHLREVRCPSPANEATLLDIAVTAIAARLPLRHPLWRVFAVTGPDGGCHALVVVLHHVLADGIGGLAILGALVDGADSRRTGTFPRPAPHRWRLLTDAAADRVARCGHPWRAVHQIGDAITELRATRPPRAPRTSLNRPVGPRRELRTVRVELAPVHAAARRNGASVNDLILTAVGGALGRLLARRDEHPDHLVVSVPVSARRVTTTDRLGNAVGIRPIAVPASGPPSARLVQVADRTSQHAGAPRAASAPLLDATFRAVSAIGALTWLVNHQHFVNTFVTNVRGPEHHATLLGATVRSIVPVTTTTGNVPVVFGALSYAGTLVLTVAADPDVCRELDQLAADLRSEVQALCETPRTA